MPRPSEPLMSLRFAPRRARRGEGDRRYAFGRAGLDREVWALTARWPRARRRGASAVRLRVMLRPAGASRVGLDTARCTRGPTRDLVPASQRVDAVEGRLTPAGTLRARSALGGRRTPLGFRRRRDMARTAIGALFTLLALGAAACGGEGITGPSGIEVAPTLASITAAAAPIVVGQPGDENQNGWICYRRIVTGVDDGGTTAVDGPPRSITMDDSGDSCPAGFQRLQPGA